MSKVSILVLTMDRYDLTNQCVTKALKQANYDYELLWCDNGSTDDRIKLLMPSFQPTVARLNSSNEGIAKALNQLILRANEEYICCIDNDIELPNSWLQSFLHTYEAIPESGVVGIHCVEAKGNVEHTNNREINISDCIFGTKFFHRKVIDKIGGFDESFGLYGLEDRDFSLRASKAGFKNYYLGNLSSEHLGADGHLDTEYRKMKWEALEKSSLVFEAKALEYDKPGGLYVPLPERIECV